jgi:hypothetical protein
MKRQACCLNQGSSFRILGYFYSTDNILLIHILLLVILGSCADNTVTQLKKGRVDAITAAPKLELPVLCKKGYWLSRPQPRDVTTEYIFSYRWNRVSVSAHSAGAYTATLLVMVNVIKGGWVCTPHPHQPGLILPSWLNVRQKATVAILCTLWMSL